MAYTSTSSLGQMSSPSSSSFQEGDGIKKSGNIILLTGNKKRGQPAYAVLSERALELHESEKAHRKKKGNRAIVDLSKCFNVSQQNCPKTRVPCVCLLMPDECFLFRAENAHETAEWYCNLLSTIISSRALHLGRPVFANEFFECVWDVTVCPQQPPKLKKVPAPPNNSTEFANSINICGKLPELAGHKRLCFYPHTIIICKVGIEPAHSGLPKSGIPPFRTMDFVEFSRHFIAQYGQVDKYFLMRIGRSSPMGACEVWIQCESEDAAIEVNRKLQEIIQRETEKKQQALMTIRGQQQQQAVGQQHLINDQRLLPSCSYTSHYSIAPGSIPNSPSSTASPMTSPSNAGNSGRIAEKTGSFPLSVSGIEQLEPISEDEQQNNTNQTTARKKCPSSLSQSAREKRLELRERKAKIDSLEEEEQRFQQRQMLVQKQQQQAAGWTPTKRYMAIKSLDPNAYRTGGTLTGEAIISRPNCLFDQQAKTMTKGYQIRRRGSSGGLETENSARSKSLGLEEHSQKQSFHPFGGVANRLWSMDKADSLLLLGYGQAEEETEDSGGTLRMIPCDQEGSQAASRSSSSLNLFAANPTSQTAADTTMHSSSRSSSAGQLVETYVECHASTKNDDEENSNNGSSTSSAEEEGIDHHYHHEEKARQKLQRRKVNARRQQRQLMTTSGADESLDGGTEADQSCSCSESLASSSGQDEQRQQQLSLAAQPNVDAVEKKHSCPIEQQQQFSNPNANLEYTLMDKVSCSSDSFSHLVVPQQQWDRQDGSNYFPEEICSYTSDSADSCYSSMANGQLNPRAFSFSSTSDAVPARAHFGPNKLVGKPHSSQTQSHQLQHPAAAKWTAAMAHRNYLFQHQQQPTAHFSPPKFCNSGQQMSSSAQQHLDSSSSSRFSMETSLTTPLEEDEQQVTFADEEQRGQTSNFSSKPTTVDADDSLRKRAFSLGSKSWITKPFSKLTSSHGTSSIGRQQRSSYGGGTSRSGSSSLVGSMHADLCSVQEQSSQTQLSHENRLGSASSFASSSAAGPVNSRDLHTRSDSIGSNHSAAVSLPGLSHRLRKKQPSEEHLKNEDLVELEFMPSKMPFTNRSSQYVATTPTDHSLRGRTSSYDDQQSSNNNVIVSGYCTQQKMLPSEGQYCVAVRAPPGRGSACSLNHTIGAGTSTAQQLQGWQQQQQRLRPSESFIRSIQQQQKELQKVRQQKQRQRLRNDFPLQEVQCFIAPAEREKIDALTSRDSLSIRSQRSGSGSCSQHFETIDECMAGASLNLQQQPQTEAVVKKHRTNSRMSSKSTHSTSSASPESQLSTIIGSGANNDGDYILGEIKPGETTSATMTA